MGEINIGSKIRLYRKSKRMTQQELSEISGVPRVSISKYEREDSIPTLDVVSKFVEVLDIPIKEIFPCYNLTGCKEEEKEDIQDSNSLKASELINILQKLIKSYGDLKVIFEDQSTHSRKNILDALIEYKNCENSIKLTNYDYSYDDALIKATQTELNHFLKEKEIALNNMKNSKSELESINIRQRIIMIDEIIKVKKEKLKNLR